MRLDTGCESALEWASVKAMAHRTSVTRDVSIGLSSVSIHYSRRCSTRRPKPTKVEIGVHDEQIFSGEGGLLGNGVLSKFRVTIDTPGRRVILDKARLAPELDPVNAGATPGASGGADLKAYCTVPTIKGFEGFLFERLLIG